MNWTCEHVNYEPLKPAASDEEYALHLAALEWSLADPIVITSRGDIKSEANWKGRFEPYAHQVQNLATFTRRLPVTLLADDVGLGKTISAGLILAELIVRKRVNRALVICPAILGPQWEEELESKFQIRAKFAKGAEFDIYRSRAGAPILITTYDTARARLGSVRPDEFDMLILDEAHKLRNLHGTQKPPEIATKVRDALKNRVFKYVLMLTATPIQNRVWDLYSLIDLLTIAKGHRNPLGEPWEFQATYLNTAAGRSLDQSRAEQFRSILRQYVVRTRREDAQLKFPRRDVETRKLAGTDVEAEMLEIVAEHIGQMNGLAQISISQAMMSSPQALADQLETMTARDGQLQSASAAARALADRNPLTAKLNGLMTLVRMLRQQRPKDWRVIVFTMRRETQNAIGRALEAEQIRVGYIRGGRASDNHEAIRRFRLATPEVNVIVSTDAGAEGVNLQVCNVLVNYDLPWNPMIVEQRIGRVQRLGTTHDSVEVVNFAVAGSVEERVVARLLEKLQVISHTIGDIETILESTGQDDEGSYEEQIRKMVVDSLKGVDVDDATQKQLASIELAKQMLERERENIETVLGTDSSQPEDRLRPPKVEPVKPSMWPEQFVMKALTAEGARITPRPDDTLDVTWHGKPSERITFKPEVAEKEQSGVFMGNTPKLYLPGRPPFEKLVQRWLLRAGHSVRDLSADLEGDFRETAAAWCASVPDASFVDAHLLGRTIHSDVRMLCKVKATNGVDSLEKILHVNPVDGDKEPPVTPEAVKAAAVILKPLSPKELLNGRSDGVAEHSTKDTEITAFCEFYGARLREEIGKCGSDTGRQKKVLSDLSPNIFADVVGMSGYRYEVTKAKIDFRVDGHYEYAAEVELLPATGKILAEPERKECVLTRRSLPENCVAICDISGSMATAHLLVKSAESGRRALPEYAITCAVAGVVLLTDEVWKSALTGKQASRKFFKSSPVSGRLGLPEDFTTCDFSKSDFLLDEVAISELSGRQYRKDLQSLCSVSGASGHISEFVRCQETKVLVAPVQTGESAVSKLVVRRDLLIHSAKPPHRLGLERESVTCALTGLKLLVDEVVKSAVSGKAVDRELATFSESSGKPALPDEVVYCEVSGKPYMPEEVGASDVSGRRVAINLLSKSPVSGRRGLAEEFDACEITGAQVLRDELVVSDESGKRFRKDELETSSESGKIGHQSEFTVCNRSGRPLLKSEANQSAVSAKTYSKKLLAPSAKSHRLGLEAELVHCQKTGQVLLSDEVDVSAVSGKTFDRDLLVASDRSKKMALPEELLRCEVTGARLLPSETAKSDLSNRIAGDDQFEISPVSGRRGLKDEFRTCEVTSISVLEDELLISDESGRRFRKDQAAVSEESGRSAHSSETVVCTSTGKRVLVSESALSAITGAAHNRKVLKASEKPPGRLGLDSDLVTCAKTGRRLLSDEVASSAVSGKLFDKDLLVPSALSRKLALPDEMVVCAKTRRRVLPKETVVCAVSGLRVATARSVIGLSEVSRKPALLEHLTKCEVTGKTVLPTELAVCAATGKKVLPTELGLCVISQKRVLKDQLVSSVISGASVLPEFAVRSPVTGRVCLPLEALNCAWLGEKLPRDEVSTCSITGLQIANVFLNESHELKELRDALDGRGAEVLAEDVRIWLSGPLAKHGTLKSVSGFSSSDGKMRAACVEFRTLLGFKVRHIGCIVSDRGPRQIVGKILLGRRIKDHWTPGE